MVEKERVIQKTFTYKGLFRYREFFRLVDFWLRDKFYDKKERGSGEYRYPAHKQIQLYLEPWKKVTDYYKITLRIEIVVRHMKEMEVEINGKKERLNEGEIECTISSYLTQDYDNRMERKHLPFLLLIRHMWQNHVYRHISKKYLEMAVDECTDLMNTLQSYLNTFPKKQEASFESGREHTRYA